VSKWYAGLQLLSNNHHRNKTSLSILLEQECGLWTCASGSTTFDVRPHNMVIKRTGTNDVINVSKMFPFVLRVATCMGIFGDNRLPCRAVSGGSYVERINQQLDRASTRLYKTKTVATKILLHNGTQKKWDRSNLKHPKRWRRNNLEKKLLHHQPSPNTT